MDIISYLPCTTFHSSQLGDTWDLNAENAAIIEEFTCCIYNYPREKHVNKLRIMMLKKMIGEDQQLTKKSKVDLAKLPPCQDSLIPHLQRVNHRVACFKNAATAMNDNPKPYDIDQGWVFNDGILEPVWSKGPILPTSMVDILDAKEVETDSGDELSDIDEDDNDLYDDDHDDLIDELNTI